LHLLVGKMWGVFGGFRIFRDIFAEKIDAVTHIMH